MKKIWIFAGVLVVAGVAGWEFRDRLPFLSSFIQQASADTGDSQPQGAQRRRGAGGPPPAVKTVAATRASLPMDVAASGAANADENTTIAAQQPGIVVRIAATEGAYVKTGDLIAKLDDRTAKAALDKDKALLVRDQATLTQAQTALARANDLLHGNAGTQQAVDQAKAAQDTAAATVQSDNAAIAADQIDLDHTDIRAPFDGRLGDIDISTGAYLSAGSAVVTIAKYDPIYVKFHLPEAYLGQLKQGTPANAVAVDAVPQGGGPSATGTLSFFDNSVDPASGTILAKAKFDNPSGALWPGQSLNVTVHFRSDDKDIVVPTVAVNPGVDSPFVYAVGDDKKVHVTPVKIARSNGPDTAIASGLTEGAHVVVEGQVQLVDGATVVEQFGNGQKTAGAKRNDQPIEVGAAQ
ncbi:efflux RND transporter periplasmic adaptor subunit [Neorhizobium galegae]|uniref:efflux RND transporter periplasmic adaptor subunit n=1 Tax=Neorhizobium galegae TaxID=399 RepID=UPI000621BBCF|nr:efflux RND transporter periplasmic adaptor subunit [Neorhizobium galegae]CDZ29378.1 Multidrug resistance protein MdtA [Neorhizobium galegae bv. officinalis]KAA9386432.1 efflux RND transporter periplasmic adaptor subunit [Neorhizobium galegae]KAB1112713.1 efflux RND transporter periplasmic adaptor subunit [Neorhizobium galegae]MCM2500644.1 efflux RND transporter periplasmic adaptor subunit [Neorhizobium galegae]MCQ1772105.1 efflux RND transporter periplasmic adaptor subunit [Neorhizobium gal